MDTPRMLLEMGLSGGDDPWEPATAAGGRVAAAMGAAVGLDLDLQDFAVLGAGERLEGQAAN